MEFKGTIVITDPCYVIKSEDWSHYLDVTDFGSIYQVDYDGMKHIISDTLYGDWSCTTIKTLQDNVLQHTANVHDSIDKLIMYEEGLAEFLRANPEDEPAGWEHIEQLDYIHRTFNYCTAKDEYLGQFCADAGLVGVFLLEEILKYRPDFMTKVENYEHCFTIIPDFDGDVDFYTHNGDGESSLHVVGKGNINFYTSQTEL